MIHFVHLTVAFDTVVNERNKMSWEGWVEMFVSYLNLQVQVHSYLLLIPLF